MEVRHGVRRLSQRPSKLRIYQDGLPVCGPELELAQQLAANGSRNHRLIVDLVEQGALLTGAEDPEHGRAPPGSRVPAEGH